VWPRLVAWASSAKNVYSGRAKRAADLRVLRFKIAAVDPSYFVAYASFNITLSFGLFGFTQSLGTVSSVQPALVVAAFVGRLILSLLAGGLAGNILGLSMVIMRRKEKAARAVG
jgi:hypothetical protein